MSVVKKMNPIDQVQNLKHANCNIKDTKKQEISIPYKLIPYNEETKEFYEYFLKRAKKLMVAREKGNCFLCDQKLIYGPGEQRICPDCNWIEPSINMEKMKPM